MGKTYSQLDLDERIEVFRLHSEGRSHREIGRMVGRHHTTIMRELGRNSLKSGYKPGMANHMAWARCRRGLKLERCSKRARNFGRCASARIAKNKGLHLCSRSISL